MSLLEWISFMSYAQLVLFYLMATVLWMAFTELWSRKAAIILLWTLVVNLVKNTTTRTFNQWYNGLTGMTVTIHPKMNRQKALAYYAARDFVHLDFQQKHQVGFQMGLCDHFDAMREEENLEEYIFSQIIRDQILD